MKYFDAIENLPPEIKLALIQAFEAFREEIAETVKRSDFENLRIVVQELAEAQKRTEMRIEELAEAQKRTEIRIEELAEAQKRTEMRIEELAEAQKRTEREIRTLAIGLKQVRTELGGLSHTIGYRLEDESYKALPALLKSEGINVVGKLKRDYLEVSKGKYIEVNIWGEAVVNSTPYMLVGEAKARLKKTDIDSFIKKADELKRHLLKDQIRILVAYQASPDVREYAKEKGIKLYFSYEF